MSRKFCTDCDGKAFKKTVRDKVWNNAQEVDGKDSEVWRIDKYGKLIKYDQYGKTSSSYGWEIDHSKPVAKGGTDHINNLQALYWKHNRLKGNIHPFTKTKLEKLKKEAEKKKRKKKK